MKHLITYNPYPYLRGMRRELGRQGLNPAWLCIFADPVPGAAPADWRADANSPSRAVFLSWADYQDAALQGPALHLDGGIDLVNEQGISLSKKATVIYTGDLGAHAGADLLAASLDHLDQEIDVIVCGRGRSAALEAARKDKRHSRRLHVRGMLSEAELHRVCLEATCFVNPRPNVPSARHNFPSKILRYLAYGRPVASTRTPGLSPAYENVLTYATEDTPSALALAIEHAVAAASDERLTRDRLEFARERTWSAQARRFLDFLEA